MFGIFKTAKWNKEEVQIEIASYIFEAATVDHNASDKVFYLQNKMNWSNKETADRCAHAFSMLGASLDKDTYEKCKFVAKNLYTVLRSFR